MFEEFKGLVTRRGGLRLPPGTATTPLPQDFELVPLDEEVELRIARAMQDVDLSPEDEMRLLVATILRCLDAQPQPGSRIAHIAANSFGQYAFAFRDGEETERHTLDYDAADGIPAEDMPLNRILRRLGVERGEAADEVAALGLRLPDRKPLGGAERT